MSKHRIILTIAVLVSLLVGTQNLFAATLIKYESSEGGISYEVDGAKMAGVTVEQLEFRDTGKTETIAGYTGMVYLSTTRVKSSFSDKTSTSEVVLSDHPDVYLASEAMSRFSKAVAGSFGAGMQDIQKMLNDKKLGMLRSDEMRLVSIKNKRISAKLFELPAEPTNFSDMIGDAGQQGGKDGGADSGFLGGIFGNKANWQKNRKKPAPIQRRIGQPTR